MKPYTITIFNKRRAMRYEKWFTSATKAWDWAWQEVGTADVAISVKPA